MKNFSTGRNRQNKNNKSAENKYTKHSSGNNSKRRTYNKKNNFDNQKRNNNTGRNEFENRKPPKNYNTEKMKPKKEKNLNQNWDNSYEKPIKFHKDNNRNRQYKEKFRGKRGVNNNKETNKYNQNEKYKTTYSEKKTDITNSEFIRLNRYLANAGICSRREADEYIKAGVVTVNGKLVTQVGTKVTLQDEIKYNGSIVRPERKVYVLLNKPKDYVTTMDDPHAKRTVMELVKNACRERIYPVGRLDRNTTGVLLFTNDGDLAKKLTHPKYEHKKIYHVFLDKNVRPSDLQQLTEGVKLDDGYLAKADEASYVNEIKSEVGIEIHSGENRVVRRMFEALGYDVIKLDRVYFAGLTKKNLPRGKWRFLTEKEISTLKLIAGK